MADVQRHGAGRPAWPTREWPDRKLKWANDGLLDLLKVRSRALLAATFAEGCWTVWPWDESALRTVLASSRKVLSLFMQAEATVNNDKPGTTLIPMRMIIEYPRSSYKSVDISLGEVDPRAGQRISFAVAADASLHTAQNAQVSIAFSVDAKAYVDARSFIEQQLVDQLTLDPSLARFYPRENFGRVAPRTPDERLWDARVRFCDFVRRFLTVYGDRTQDDLNPFVAFFLKPRAYDGGDAAAHIRSGFFGYQYDLDPGQTSYLADLSQANSLETMYREYVHFPEGLCSQIFLSGRPAMAYTNDIIATYEQPETTFSRIERTILRSDSLLLEIPIFETRLIPHELLPDGPERIIAISFPTGTNIDSAGRSVLQGAAVAALVSSNSEPPPRSGLAPGETQAIFEMTQRLVARYVTVTPNTSAIEGLVGDSNGIRKVHEIVHRYARQTATVLILGETGTGKDIVARALHELSPRPKDKWKVVDCAALTEHLAGSELFGHVKGAYTGADRSRQGAFESAQGGTVFINEVGELSLELQKMLLRVLENREYSPLGSDQTKQTTARVIAATNRNLEQMVANGTFRRDLYFRLKILPIHLPSLRERREDVPLLLDHFLRQKHRLAAEVFDDAAWHHLLQYEWPGNVRELRNIVEQAVAQERLVAFDDLIDWLGTGGE